MFRNAYEIGFRSGGFTTAKNLQSPPPSNPLPKATPPAATVGHHGT
jgi:hypothetical protein